MRDYFSKISSYVLGLSQNRRRFLSALVVAFWLLACVAYFITHRPKVRQPLGVPTGEFVDVRDPQTGDMRHMPIRRYR